MCPPYTLETIIQETIYLGKRLTRIAFLLWSNLEAQFYRKGFLSSQSDIKLGWRFRCCGLLSEAINLDYLEAETRHLLDVTKKNISIFRSFHGIESPRLPNMVLAKQSDYKIRSRKKNSCNRQYKKTCQAAGVNFPQSHTCKSWGMLEGWLNPAG